MAMGISGATGIYASNAGARFPAAALLTNGFREIGSGVVAEDFTVADYQRVRHEVERRKLAFYRPYPKQAAFHKASATYRETLLRAGNQLGKTVAAAAQTAIFACGRYPPWWEGRVFKKPTVGWCAGVTGEVVRDSIQRLLLGDVANPGTGFIPPEDIVDITPSRGVADLADTILVKSQFGGTSRIRLKYYEQGREKFQADTVDFCIAEGQFVQMADGRNVPIEKVRAGEYVLTTDKRGRLTERKVLSVHDNGLKRVVEIETSRGPWLQATPNHEVYITVRDKERADKASRILMLPGDWEPKVCLVNLPDAYYAWAGLTLSEGTVSQKKITMGEGDAISTAIALLPEEAAVRKYIFKNGHVPDWHLNWPDFWALIYPGKAYEKKIPDWVFMSPNKNIKIFLAYLYAGDGWVSGHSVGYATTSRALAEQLSLILWRFGIRSSIHRVPSKNNWREQWHVMISSCHNVIKFLDEITIPDKEVASKKVRLEAERRRRSTEQRRGYNGGKPRDKYKRQLHSQRERFTSVQYVRPVGEKRVYDLTIDEHHKFSVGMKIVSNCWPDEEPPLDIYLEMLTRTNATRGLLYMTFTPLKGMSEVVRRFLLEQSPDRIDINMTIDDALHIPPEERKRIIDSYPAHERSARINGTPVLGSGRIFPIADEEIAVKPFNPLDMPWYWMEIAGIDFGWDHPTAAAKLLYDPQGDIVYVTSVYKRREATPLIHAAALKPWGAELQWAWPHDGLQHDKGSGVQLRQQYQDQGLKMLAERATFDDDRSNGVEAGIAEMLMRMESGRFKVFSHLTEFFEEFRLYHRKEGKVVKEFDDILCAVRHALMMIRYAQPIRPPAHATANGGAGLHKSNYQPLSPSHIRKYLEERK